MGDEDIPQVEGSDYQLEIRGLVRDTRSWSLPELYRMQQESQITPPYLRGRMERDWRVGQEYHSVIF